MNVQGQGQGQGQGSRSRSAILVIKPFDGKCQNLQVSPIIFCASTYLLRIINYYFFLQKVGQGPGVEFSQLHIRW